MLSHMHQVKEKKGILVVFSRQPESPFLMTKIAELSTILQQLLTTSADRLAKETGFIKRERQVSGANFAQTLVLGGLGNPEATYKQLHQHSIQAGMKISVQGLDQRFNERGVHFMRALLEAGLEKVVESEKQNVILPQFNGIYITDCTRLVWKQLGIKMGVRWEVQRGKLQTCLMELKQNDQKAEVVDRELPAQSLHIGDLGFFKLDRFRQWNESNVYWLTRYKTGTHLYTPEKEPIDLISLLKDNDEVNMPVIVGSGNRGVPAQLIARRISEEGLVKRLARLKEQARLDQRPTTQRQLELAQWTIYLTNVPDLTFDQAHVLIRLRWQIELLFKLWKSHAHVLKSRSANPFRQQCEGLAKLLGVIIAHWSLLVSGWQLDLLSPVDALRLVRTFIPTLHLALVFLVPFTLFFDALQRALDLSPRPSKRRKTPLAFQSWYDLEDQLA
jgi:hypothetical protein